MRRIVLLAAVFMLLAGFAAVSLAGPGYAAAGGYFYHDSIVMGR